MGALKSSLEAYSAWIDMVWFFSPITVLVIINLKLSKFNDNYQYDNSEMTPIFGYSQV